MNITQNDIDGAVLNGKYAGYILANELALEQKYGGKIDCCITKLKLIWMWTDALSCEKQAVSQIAATGKFGLSSSHVNDTINILVNGISISGVITLTSTNLATMMTLITNTINAHQSFYICTTDGKIITISGGCESRTISFVITGTSTASVTSQLTGTCEVKANTCLTDAQIKSLIGKLNSLCD